MLIDERFAVSWLSVANFSRFWFSSFSSININPFEAALCMHGSLFCWVTIVCACGTLTSDYTCRNLRNVNPFGRQCRAEISERHELIAGYIINILEWQSYQTDFDVAEEDFRLNRMPVKTGQKNRREASQWIETDAKWTREKAHDGGTKREKERWANE